MKIIVFSDLHIAHPMIDEEILENLFIDIAANTTPDTIICFTGDLFHKRVDLNDIYSQQGITLFQKIDELNVPVIVIEGTHSHDYKYIDTFLTLKLKNFTFVQTHTELLKFKNNLNEEIDILCIPEEYPEDQFQFYANTVYTRKKYDLVLMHGTFTDVLFHNVHIEKEALRSAPKFDSKDFSRHTLTLSGHIHRHQILGKKKNIMYVGSYSNMNFGDDKSSHMVVIDLDKDEKKFDYELIDNIKSHKFEEIELDPNITYEEFDKSLSSMIKNKSSREHFKVYYSGKDETIRNVLNQLRKDNLIKKVVLSTPEEEQTKIVESEEEIDYMSIYSGSLEDNIKAYIKDAHNIDVDIEVIKQIIRKEA